MSWGLPLFAALAACSTGPSQGAYQSAEKAVADEDWDRAAELWYDIHLGEESKTERSYMETSRALYESGDAESACSMLRFGRQEHPRSGEMLALHGSILETNGYQRAAEDAYSGWAEIETNNPEAYLALGRVRLCLGWEHAAGLALVRSQELAPKNARVQVQLAKLRRATGEDDQAFQHFTLAWELGAEDPLFYLDGSLTAMELGVAGASPAVGLEWAELVAELRPQNTCAHFLRGVHLQALGRRDEAIEAFSRAVETDPACLEGLTRLAKLYSEVGEVDRMVDLVTRALALETDPEDRDRLLALVAPK